MHQIQADIGVPRIKIEKINDNHVIFTMSPLPTGYGLTLGNAIRRVLLSSLPGACISAVKIDGVNHEYSTIKGVKESVLDIMLNLKTLHIKSDLKEPTKIRLSVSKPGKLTAKDIEVPTGIEIMNPDTYITTLEKGTKLNIVMIVEKGVGFITANQRKKNEDDPSLIVMDAVFSPVKKVRYDVEATRVGEMTNLDKLTLEIVTNGSITPEDALKFSSNILQSYFGLFNEEKIMIESDFMSDFDSIIEKEKEDEKKKPAQEAYTPIEILGFSPRTLNALINGGIGSIEQLSKCTESKLVNLRGFGKKALTEVSTALEQKGLTLSEE